MKISLSRSFGRKYLGFGGSRTWGARPPLPWGPTPLSQGSSEGIYMHLVVFFCFLCFFVFCAVFYVLSVFIL